MLITKEIRIHMGHKVTNHESKCRSPHGHEYKFQVTVDGNLITKKGASNEGMVIDFKDLKEIMMKEIDERLDHGFMIYKNDMHIELFRQMKNDGLKVIEVDFIPTVENIAIYIFELLEKSLLKKKIKMHEIKIWETYTSSATYRK